MDSDTVNTHYGRTIRITFHVPVHDRGRTRVPERTPYHCQYAPAPAATEKVSAKDTQVGLSSGLVNTAAGATSGDDVAGALKAARRSK